MEVDQYLVSTTEDGKPKRAAADDDFKIGMRVIAGKDMPSPGYCCCTIGLPDLNQTDQIVREGLSVAYQRAQANAWEKRRLQRKFPGLGNSLFQINLASVRVHVDDYESPYKIDPRGVPLSKLISLSKETSVLFQKDLKTSFISTGHFFDRIDPSTIFRTYGAGRIYWIYL